MPQSGVGITLLTALNVLSYYNLGKYRKDSSLTYHLLAEALRRGHNNRSHHVGDPDYYDVPTEGLISKGRAKLLAKSISFDKASKASSIQKYNHIEESKDTTHYSVIDRNGNAVSNTYTLGSSFGSGVTVSKGGILMNNQMRNFSHFYGTEENTFGSSEANRLEPGKRMISTQTPTLVFDKDDNLMMILGSPGGGRIPNIITQVISNVIDHGLSFTEAVMAPRINQRLEGKLQLENGFSPDTIKLLIEKEHTPESSMTMGSVQAVFLENEKLYGVSDTRRPGSASMGD